MPAWQKGGIELSNGRIQGWLSRDTDLNAVTDKNIQDVAIATNLAPRKCLAFKSPIEAFLNQRGKDVAIRFNMILLPFELESAHR